MSRLCFELAERCRARGVPVYEAHGVAHGKLLPLLPVLELFRAYYGITDQDTAPSARIKIAGRLLLLDVGFEPKLPLVFDFLGVPDPERPPPALAPETREHEMRLLVKQVVHARSRHEPAVMLLEDLHWFDSASEAVLETLVEATAGTRTLLLVTFRPEFHAGWMQRSHYQQLPLLPLGLAAAKALLSDLLGEETSTVGLAERICERTGGNPFFIEEVVQELVETGRLTGVRGLYLLAAPVEDLAIPPTVQSVLAARIDRLGEREKSVLQTAAVIGKEFSEAVLRRVADETESGLAPVLQILVAGDFLNETALYPEAEYAFKHPLTQEVAYGSQLGARRARVHERVARTIEALDVAKLDERAALIAHHWDGAGDGAAAARWHRRAADWVMERDLEAARVHWERVRVLAGRIADPAEQGELGATACSYLLSVGFRYCMDPDSASALFDEGRARAHGEPRLLAMLHGAYGAFRGIVVGRIHEHIDHAREAVRFAERSGDATVLLTARAPLAASLAFRGQLRAALEVADRMLAETPTELRSAPDVWGFSPYVWAVGHRGWVLADLGDLPAAGRALREAFTLLGSRESPHLRLLIQLHAVKIANLLGDAPLAYAHAQDMPAALGRDASPFNKTFVSWGFAIANLLRGAFEEANNAAATGLAIVRQHDIRGHETAFALYLMAEAKLGQGELAEARTAAEHAVASANQGRWSVLELTTRLTLARVLVRAEGAGARIAIESALAAAAALAEETGAAGWVPFIHVERAELARVLGDEAARQHELGEAHRLFVEIGAPLRAARVAEGLR